ncbi:hypothetical protein Trydic_g3993 [Trypoxylus dichotomus]
MPTAKTLRTLRSDPDSIILPADKDGAYIPLKRDLTLIFERKTSSLIKASNIPLEIQRRLISRNSKPPRLYGLPKIHKDGVLLRPVVSTIDSSTYNLTKHLSRIIKEYTGKTSSHILKSTHFVELISEITIQPTDLFSQYYRTATTPGQAIFLTDKSHTSTYFAFEEFDGSGNARELDKIKSMIVIHKWPDSYALKIAWSNLFGGAWQWWRTKGKDIYTFANLAAAFERTFLKAESLPLKWKRVTELVQHKGRLAERRTGDNNPLCFKCRKYGHVAKYSRNGKIICYTCRKEGHIGKNYPGETKENLVIKHLIEDVDQNANYFKEARINGDMVRGYIDPGSKVVTIRKIGLTWESMKESYYMTGYGAGKVMPLSESTINIEVAHARAAVVVLVVPDEAQIAPVLIGQPFTEQQHITMDEKRKAKWKKKKARVAESCLLGRRDGDDKPQAVTVMESLRIRGPLRTRSPFRPGRNSSGSIALQRSFLYETPRREWKVVRRKNCLCMCGYGALLTIGVVQLNRVKVALKSCRRNKEKTEVRLPHQRLLTELPWLPLTIDDFLV